MTLIAAIGSVIMFASCKKEASPVASNHFKYDNSNLKEIIHRASPTMYNRIYNHEKGPIVTINVEMGRLLANPADFDCYEPYNLICAITITTGTWLQVDSTNSTIYTTSTATVTGDNYTQGMFDSVLTYGKDMNWNMNFNAPGKGTLILARPDAPVAIDAKKIIAKDTVTATGDTVKVIKYEQY